jgi:hypothetical protein
MRNKNRIPMFAPRSALDPIINHLGGRIFTVEFIKQNGEHRVMNCRKGVKAYLKGGENPLRYGNHPHLRVVFDMKKLEYRMINLDTVTILKSNGSDCLIMD